MFLFFIRLQKYSSYLREDPKNKGHGNKNPTWVAINFVHNHSISTSSALRFRDVPKEIEAKFCRFFMTGLSVNSALSLHIEDVKAATPEQDWKYALVDRAKVPDKSWCYK